jgi:hypothetical protein
MPHPFSPEDFPINEDVEFTPTQVFYLKGAIHFKNTAKIIDLSGQLRQPFNNFSNAFAQEASQVARKLEEQPTYEIKSCGEMMRTIKTMTSASTGERLCDLNITFVSFGSSYVRFAPGSKHSRHEIEMCPVDDRAGFSEAQKHEAFVKNSIPYFWDMTNGPFGVLYKCLNQKRVEIAKVAAFGFEKDAILVLNANELDEVVALSTCIILLNGRDAMDH